MDLLQPGAVYVPIPKPAACVRPCGSTPFGLTVLTPRTKKLLGTLAILVWLPIYALIAMRIGVAVLPEANGLVTFLYYAVAGTVWIVPIGLMLPWMHREPKR
jgi:hypothetical protein